MGLKKRVKKIYNRRYYLEHKEYSRSGFFGLRKFIRKVLKKVLKGV